MGQSKAVGSPFVEVTGVTKTYASRDGQIKALDDTYLTVRRGEFLSIVGPSGCGKSTLLLMIAGLIRPTSGTISIGGSQVTKAYTDLGIVFQDSVLLDWRSVLDNLMLQVELRGLDNKRYRQRALDLLAQTGLGGFERKHPFELSGGMRQRVSICRALVHDPPLLLMDEPFGALDALTRDQMNVDLQTIWEQSQKTVLFVTHSVAEAVLLSDRVVVMSPRPGHVEGVIEVDLPRPRGLHVRETPEFSNYARRVRAIFEARGVLRETHGVPPSASGDRATIAPTYE